MFGVCIVGVWGGEHIFIYRWKSGTPSPASLLLDRDWETLLNDSSGTKEPSLGGLDGTALLCMRCMVQVERINEQQLGSRHRVIVIG